MSARTGKGHIYPNLYVLLVGPPGAGKSIIEVVKELWAGTREPGGRGRAFFVASDSVTSASIVDELAKAKFIRVLPKGPPLVYHSLLVASEELQVLLPAYDTMIIGKLNSLYNNSAIPYTETRRTGSVREITIENPHVTIIAGAQPAYFASTFPEEVWSTGFARRVIMVYSDEVQMNSLWFEPRVDDLLKPSITSKLEGFSQLIGTAKWTPAAAAMLDEWHMAGGPPAPKHSKLAQYVRNRSVNVIKLALISAVSRTSALVIEELDVKRAMEWLFAAELRMPDIFRAMVGKSDTQVIEELHYYVTAKFNSGGKKAIPGGDIMRFLLQRVPSEKANFIFQAMLRANMLAQPPGTADLYVPRPKSENPDIE